MVLGVSADTHHARAGCPRPIYVGNSLRSKQLPTRAGTPGSCSHPAGGDTPTFPLIGIAESCRPLRLLPRVVLRKVLDETVAPPGVKTARACWFPLADLSLPHPFVGSTAYNMANIPLTALQGDCPCAFL